MPSKASIKVTKVTTRTKSSTAPKSQTNNKGNTSKCPTCGKFKAKV